MTDRPMLAMPGQPQTCPSHLPSRAQPAHAPLMFVVSEAEAAAIRTAYTAYEGGGELSAAVELRRLFPGISDLAEARTCARTIAGWQPLPPGPEKPRGVGRRVARGR
jgi:hypothetical protein